MGPAVRQTRCAQWSGRARSGAFDGSGDFGVCGEVAAERFEGLKRFGAYVVFHAFDVVGDDGFFEAELAQETG